MADMKNLTLLQEQRLNKPPVDGFIDEYLDGDLKKTAADFVNWLRAMKLTPKWGSSINTWNAFYKSKSIVSLRIDMWHTEGHHRGYYDARPGSPPCFVVIPRLNDMERYREAIFDVGLQDLIWDNANSCVYSERSPSYGMAKAPGCSPGKPCAPGRDLTVLGRAIKHNCGCFLIMVWNPDETKIDGVKKLLEMEKKARDKSNI